LLFVTGHRLKWQHRVHFYSSKKHQDFLALSVCHKEAARKSEFPYLQSLQWFLSKLYCQITRAIQTGKTYYSGRGCGFVKDSDHFKDLLKAAKAVKLIFGTVKSYRLYTT
jgi:hypothetical protein